MAAGELVFANRFGGVCHTVEGVGFVVVTFPDMEEIPCESADLGRKILEILEKVYERGFREAPQPAVEVLRVINEGIEKMRR